MTLRSRDRLSLFAIILYLHSCAWSLSAPAGLRSFVLPWTEGRTRSVSDTTALGYKDCLLYTSDAADDM
eukprot:1008871-Rhodomonas_salina.1